MILSKSRNRERNDVPNEIWWPDGIREVKRMVNKYSCAPWISRISNEHTKKNDEQTPNGNRCPSGASVKPWVMDVLHYHTYAKHKHSHTTGTWCIQHQDILCMQPAWDNNKKNNTIGFDINAPKVCLIAQYRPFQGNLVFIFICPYPLCHVLQHRTIYTYQHKKLTRQHVFFIQNNIVIQKNDDGDDDDDDNNKRACILIV